MNHYDPDTGIKVEPIEINKDLLALLYRIIEQNERILQLNGRMLELLGMPRFNYPHVPDEMMKEVLKRQFAK